MNQPTDYYNLGFVARLNGSATPPLHLDIYAVEEWNRGYRDASLEYEQA